MSHQALDKFVNYHRLNASDHQRLGQRFVNMFFRGSSDCEPVQLYFERDEEKAIEMIEQWLVDNQYTEDLPTPNQSYINAIISFKESKYG